MTAAVAAFDELIARCDAAAAAVPIPQSRPGRILGLAGTGRLLGQTYDSGHSKGT